MNRVFVTGVGLVTSLGVGKINNLKSLREDYSGIGWATSLESALKDKFLFGEIPYSTAILREKYNIIGPVLTRTDVLSYIAFSEAISDAGLDKNEIESKDTAFISASTSGGLSEFNNFYQDAQGDCEFSEFIGTYAYDAHADRVIQNYNISGITSVINTACSSSLNAIIYGYRLIKTGRASRAIVGGVDSLNKFSVNGFNSLQLLSEDACKPLDKNRCGLTLGEGSAYIVLEEERIIDCKEKYAEISGYGNNNNASHISSLSEDGEAICELITKALKMSNLRPEDIDYINTHGTATFNNDLAELMGIQKAFDLIPAYNSTKSFCGHTLGAAGAIESVFSIFSLKYQELYKSLNWNTPIKESFNSPISMYQSNYKIMNVLTNSFGFAGDCSVLIFSKV